MKNMADLDPAEEKLLAQALFETANDDYFEQDVELEGDEEGKRHVPNSKIQFPIRRRRSTLYRKLICFGILLTLFAGTVVGVYFLLKSRTVSLELKLKPGQTLRYKLEQESIYEGVKQTRSSFDEDVFVHVVNKTGNQYWLKVKINSLPSSKKRKFSFLVRVDLDKENSKDFGQEGRFGVFTSGKSERSRQMDYYVYNFLFQLVPVVKIDLFEILLSQITTRKHEVTVKDSLLFPGLATMQQNIRSSKDHILITSQIKPEGFSAFGSSKTTPELPHIEMIFEEDASIKKSSGMLETSDLELAAKIPIGENVDSNSVITMKFKSSLKFVEEITAKEIEEEMKDENFVKLPRPSSKGNTARLRYLFPTEKKYDENPNVVEKVKEMLTLGSSSHSTPRNKEIVEFSKSFHKIVKPGQEVDFAVEESGKKMGKSKSGNREEWDQPRRKEGSRQRWHESDRHQSNNDRYDYDDKNDDRTDDDRSDDDDDDDATEDVEAPYDDEDRYDGDDERGNNRSGLAVPMYPEDHDSQDDKDERYQEAKDDDEGVDDDDQQVETKNTGRGSDEPRNNERPTKPSPREDIPTGLGKPPGLVNSTISTQKDGGDDDGGSGSVKTNNPSQRSSSTGNDFHKASKKEKEEPIRRKEMEDRKDEPRLVPMGTESPTKTEKIKPTENISPTAATSPTHGQDFFSNIFDRLWNHDDDITTADADDKDDDDHNDNGFKFPFSFTSHFPFIHFRWPSFDDRKKRSLETNPQSRKPRDLGHRDKRRLFGRGSEGGTKRPHYTVDDLEAVWDVISYAKSNARPKKTTPIFQQTVFGLEVKGVLEHEVQVVSIRGDKTEWVIRLSLSLNVGEHRFKVFSKAYSMKEIEERFIKQSKPKLEYGTVHAGTLVLCTPLFYIENICIEIQLGFVMHLSHTIEHMTKEFPVELSIFFKHLTRVDALISSHMDTLLGSNGVFSHGALFGNKIPLEVNFSEERSSRKWCSVANIKTKTGRFYESRKEMSQWECQFDELTNSRSNCTGLDEKNVPKATRLWYMKGQSKKLHFLNNC